MRESDVRKHRLLIELGRGGMGTVYLAIRREQVVGRPALVVVKHLRPELAQHLRFLQGFLDESHLSIRLDHPNIVRTWDVGFEAHHYFLEMEYLEGQSLEAITRAASALTPEGLPWPVSLFLLEEILAGLHYAHELTDVHGRPLAIVHRDVSPHNVVITYDGAVKLLDFGIAKAATSSHDTSTGIIKGKLTYMAPEQAGRRAVDRRADIFPVGVMLWQALTGQRLWADVPEPLLFHKLEHGEITAPRAVRPEVPEALDAICMKALSVDPAARFETADEMRQAIAHERRERWGDVGQKELAAVIGPLFRQRRDADKAQIDLMLARGSEDSLEVLPVLGQGPGPGLPILSVGDDPRGRTSTSHRTDPRVALTRRHDARATRSGRRWIAGGLAVVGIAVGTAGVAWRSARTTVVPLVADAQPVECTMNAECVQKNDGGNFVCRKTDGVCLALEAPGCTVLAEKGDVENDATIWFGTMFPMTGKQANAFGTVSVRGTDLARRDFVQIARGIPSPVAGQPARPIGLVTCDDATDAARVARHLVNLQVPAVVGFSSSQEVIDLATELFIPNRVLAVATENRSSLIATIPHPAGEPRLVWRTTVNAAANVAPVAAVVTDVWERELRPTLPKGAALRVASLRPRNTTGLSWSHALLDGLRFNGKNALENGGNYREVLYSSTNDPQPISDATVVDALLEFRPHIVISLGFDMTAKSILAPFETRWPSSSPSSSSSSSSSSQRPRYVMTSMLGADFFQFLGKNAERRRRFISVSPPTSTFANTKLTMHYNESYSPKVSPEDAPGASYDAIYLLAYAAYATGERRVTGPGLARAIGRLIPPGQPLEVGPTRIFDAFHLLLGNNTQIDLQGAWTPLDFDLTTGEGPTDFALRCANVDETGTAIAAIEPGPIYRAATKKIEGLPLRCP